MCGNPASRDALFAEHNVTGSVSHCQTVRWQLTHCPQIHAPQNTGNGKHYQQMDQIKQELRFPFRDPRAPFRGISEGEENGA